MELELKIGSIVRYTPRYSGFPHPAGVGEVKNFMGPSRVFLEFSGEESLLLADVSECSSGYSKEAYFEAFAG